MKRRRKYRVFALALVGATAVLVLTVFPSAMNSARIIGLTGKMQDERFLVQDVDSGSPAATAGLRRGDLLTAVDGRPIEVWRELARTNLSEYLTWRRSWEDRTVEASVRRGDETFSVGITVRPLDLLELGSYFLPRLAIVIVLIVLTVFLLSSNPKDPTALFIAICFFSFIWWMGFDRPGWPKFLSPLLMQYSPGEFLFREFMVTLGMQVALGALLHVMLVFPRELLPPRIRKPAIGAAYFVPTASMAYFMLPFGTAAVIDRMPDLYNVRIWLDTPLLILAAVLIVLNSRGLRTRIQEEQGRWLTRAVIAFTVLHVSLWNLPKILIGVPLVPSYNWILLFLLLIPVALTVSIANHDLFGIRGLVRRRMRYLNAMARRRQDAVGRRDHMIQHLTEEVEQLRQELEQYMASDEPPGAGAASTERLQRLEDEYPAIRNARHSNLLGRSPLWVKVYEDSVLASRGDTPVLIVGESGTGKTELARTITAMGGREGQPYREISCAQFEHADPAFALGKLFGIGKGHGLPNTVQGGQPGLLEECGGGMLFLDDFDRLPLNAQDLLLYPLEGKAFEPGIGSGPPRQASLKFILATNRDPDELVEQGELRADVVARIGARVFIPPLRERPEDLPLLIDNFVRVIGDEFDHKIESISSRAMNILRANEYRKGNVRELYSELRTAIGKASLEHDTVLRGEYISAELRAWIASRASPERSMAAQRSRDHPVSSGQAEHGSSTESDAAVELEVLRRNSFRIQPSEEELGLSHKSKTLSNHLRGRCMQSLADNGWEPEMAARELVGSNDREAIVRVQRKMQRFLESVDRSVAEGTENRLFNNLPASYHAALTAAIRRAARV